MLVQIYQQIIVVLNTATPKQDAFDFVDECLICKCQLCCYETGEKNGFIRNAVLYKTSKCYLCYKNRKALNTTFSEDGWLLAFILVTDQLLSDEIERNLIKTNKWTLIWGKDTEITVKTTIFFSFKKAFSIFWKKNAY